MDSQEANAAQESNNYQLKFNEGQARINGQLCRVDRMLVEILKLLRLEIAKFPGFAKANKADFERIDAMLVKAYHTSAEVAHIKPPGCEPPYTADPKWTVI